jgi:hypothetical protein
VNRVKEAFWRIGSADAVTWLSFWLTCVAVFIGSLTVMPTGTSLASRFAILGIGQLILWAPLVIARLIALRMNPDRRTPIALVVLGAYLFGATIRTLFVGSAFIWLLGPDEGRWLGRASGSFGTMAIVFAITAYVVSSAREQRRRIQDLEEIQVELEQSVAEARVDIDERGERSVQQVRAILETELAQLQPVDAGGGVQSLERLARDVVRPLSHELADAAASQPEQTPRTDITVSWWKVLDLAARGRPFRPLAVSLLILVTAIGAIAAYPPGALRFLAVPLVTFVVLSAIDPLAARALRRRSLRVRLVIVLMAAAVAGVVVGACAFLLLWDQPVRVGISVATVFFVVVLSLAVAMVSAVNADRQIVIAQLEAAESQLRRNLSLVNQVKWFQEKALSRALHGPVQTTIAAAALKLDSAMKSGTVTGDLMERIRTEVSRELDVLADVTRYSVPLDEGLESIAATWDGVCQIDTVVEPEVAHLVTDDAPLRACVIAIATESVSDAIRHGKSTSVALWMSLDSVAAEVIVDMESCCPPRHDIAPSGSTGLGTRQLDECATSWALELAPEGQHLRVALPSRLLTA